MAIEFKNVSFDVKDINEETNVFEGYASVFNNKDSHDDVIEKGAFTKTIQERGHKVKVLWQHDMWTPIGKAVEMKEDEYGLFVKAKISDTDEGRRAMTLIKDGVIDELSIGYSVVKDEIDRDTGVRKLKELRLFEFSPVTFASNDRAVITGAKEDDLLSTSLMKLNQELKAGRVLSEKNKELVKNAVDALNALLEASGDNDNQKNINNASNIDIESNMTYNRFDKDEEKEIEELVNQIKLDSFKTLSESK